MNNSNAILNINNLSVTIDQKPIINNLNLTIKPGEIHAIMGPNGSGKSTLANVLARHKDYEVTSGDINFLGDNLLELSPEECACRGLFLSFQHPVAIPGVSNIQFIKASLNAIRKHKNLEPLDAIDFLNLVKAKMADLGIPQTMLKRAINDGFSGGEKKRNEILQMSILEPNLVILDEIDSGLDIDALKAVADGVNKLKDGKRAFLMITHYQRLLDYIEPDFVHVLSNGDLIHSGDKTLPLKLEQEGYAWLKEHAE